MTTSEDAVFLVGGIALEDPSTVVPISAFWNGRGWVSGGGRWSSLWSLSDVVVLMPRFCGYYTVFGLGLSIDWANSLLFINVRRTARFTIFQKKIGSSFSIVQALFGFPSAHKPRKKCHMHGMLSEVYF